MFGHFFFGALIVRARHFRAVSPLTNLTNHFQLIPWPWPGQQDRGRSPATSTSRHCPIKSTAWTRMEGQVSERADAAEASSHLFSGVWHRHQSAAQIAQVRRRHRPILEELEAVRLHEEEKEAKLLITIESIRCR